MRLKKDIQGVDNLLLVGTGTKIDHVRLEKIAKNAKNIPYIKIKNTPLAKDIERAFGDKRYKIIFAPEKDKIKILNLIKNISVPEKIVSELKNIKIHLPYTYRHILIIAILSTKLSLDKNLKGESNPKKVVQLGLVHDIGKSRISSKILDKCSPLTHKEYKILKTHPFIGYILLHHYYGKKHRDYDFASYEHHERLDGSGYPRGLKKINKYVQLISVIDVLDALISRRPYRKTPYTLRAAIDYLLDEVAQGRLNKKIVYLLTCYARKDKPSLRSLKISKEKRDKPPKGNVYGKFVPA